MVSNRISRFITAGIMTVSLSALLLLQVPAEEADKSGQGQTEAAGENILIGEKTSDADYEVTLVNKSGKDIKGIALRASYGDFSDNLLAEGDILKNEGQGTMWCTPAEIVNYVPPVYDMELTFSDGSSAVVHTLPFGDADELTVLEDEESDTAYIQFFSISMNGTSDSLTREKNIAKSGEKVLIADYEAKVANGGYAGGGEYVPEEQSSSSGGGKKKEKQCLDDGLMY